MFQRAPPPPEGELVGIGLALQRVDGRIIIHEVIDGGTAAHCPQEILEGDQICKVDGTAVGEDLAKVPPCHTPMSLDNIPR
jgi:C-terminal processing protease CtpA/Prc